MHALRADAQWIQLAAAHVAHDQEAQHLFEVVGAAHRPGGVRCAPKRAAPAVRVPWPRTASMPPVSTVTGDRTGRWYCSFSHGTRNEVSRPPE
jgi:hypothetical protein